MHSVVAIYLPHVLSAMCNARVSYIGTYLYPIYAYYCSLFYFCFLLQHPYHFYCTYNNMQYVLPINYRANDDAVVFAFILHNIIINKRVRDAALINIINPIVNAVYSNSRGKLKPIYFYVESARLILQQRVIAWITYMYYTDKPFGWNSRLTL